MEPFNALILACGQARRMGGVHKPGLLIEGVSLLDRVLAAVSDATRTVVVGPPQPVPAQVVLVRENPPGGGPVAALAAGLQALQGHIYDVVPTTAAWLAVLAGDLPFLTPAALASLRSTASAPLAGSATDADGAVLVDAAGKDQYLAGVYRVSALQHALTTVGDPAGVAFRRVVGGLDLRRVTLPTEPGTAPPWFDCDDADDVRWAESFARRTHSHEREAHG